jgi:hypothetical protein
MNEKTSGVGYLIEAVDQLGELPSRAELVHFMRRIMIDEPDAARELTADEETAIGMMLGAVQIALDRNDGEGLMRTVAAGTQLAMRFSRRD